MTRPLADHSRIQGFSLPEIKAALDLTSAELQMYVRDVWPTGPLRSSHVINAVILHFLKQASDEDRVNMVRWGLVELKRLQSLDEPEPIRGTHAMVPVPKPRTKKKGDA